MQRCMAAAADDSKALAKGKAPLSGSEQIGVLDMGNDTETIQEVMAFKGPAPEVHVDASTHIAVPVGFTPG